MATEKKERSENAVVREAAKTDLSWRKPITLDLEDEEDPLATLYRGREAGDQATETDARLQKSNDKIAKIVSKQSKSLEKPVAKKIREQSGAQSNDRKVSETIFTKFDSQPENLNLILSSKTSESELKAILKIKSETFHFTDIREILRGKSLDIYAYLRFLCGDKDACKIKHLDLMKKLEISRPTLFKQSDWLTRLSLIEKRNVPGDHLGTSYTVHRLEEVLPVSDALVKQLESHMESFGQANN